MCVCVCVYLYIRHWDKEMDLFWNFLAIPLRTWDLRSRSGTEAIPPALEASGFITAREVLGPFFLEERYHNLSNSAAGNRDRTSYPGLKSKPLTLCKVGRFKTSIYFFQHQHLIPDLTGTETYKRFTLFLWMCTLFTIQFIKYLPFYQPTVPCSALTTLLLLKADQIGGWHLSRNEWSEQLEGNHILCICQST